jgi:site-specific recombinase XerD
MPRSRKKKKITITGLAEFLSMFESKGTVSVYRSDIGEFFKTMKKAPDKITKMDVIKYLSKLKAKKLASATINRKFAALRSYYDFLVSTDVVVKNPFKGKDLRIPKMVRPDKVYLTNEERQKVVDILQGKELRFVRQRAVVYLMLYNGMRRGEICKFMVGDLIVDGDTWAVNIHGKGNKDRIRPLHSEAKKVLKEYMRLDKRFNGRKILDSAPIFINQHGNPLKPGNIYDMVLMLCRRAGIEKHISPHVFRATFTSMALEQGVPLTSVQYDLGHSSPETTAMYDRSKRALSRSSVHVIKSIKPTRKKRK